MRDRFPDRETVGDPNFDAIGDMQWSRLTGEGGDAAAREARRFFGAAETAGVLLQPAPCGLTSLREMARYFGTNYVSGLSYTFEQITRQDFGREVGPNCQTCPWLSAEDTLE